MKNFSKNFLSELNENYIKANLRKNLKILEKLDPNNYPKSFITKPFDKNDKLVNQFNYFSKKNFFQNLTLDEYLKIFNPKKMGEYLMENKL
jgi:hypothetical protein